MRRDNEIGAAYAARRRAVVKRILRDIPISHNRPARSGVAVGEAWASASYGDGFRQDAGVIPPALVWFLDCKLDNFAVELALCGRRHTNGVRRPACIPLAGHRLSPVKVSRPAGPISPWTASLAASTRASQSRSRSSRSVSRQQSRRPTRAGIPCPSRSVAGRLPARGVRRPHNPTLQLSSAQSIAVERLDVLVIHQHLRGLMLGRLQLSSALGGHTMIRHVRV